MPIYDYKCNSCEETFTETHSINDKIDSCRFCDSDDIKLMIMPFAARTENNLEHDLRKAEERAKTDRKKFQEDDKFAANITGDDDPNHQKKLNKVLREHQKRNEEARKRIKRAEQ